MTELLPNYLAGRRQLGHGEGIPLIDPIRGEPLVRVNAAGLDLNAGFAHARAKAGPALRALSYRERAELLSAAVKVLKANRDAYFEIATANSGTVKSDSAMDIEGAIFTLSYYAKLGEGLAGSTWLLDGPAVSVSKDASFRSQHVLVPTRGVALLINAYNFPAWGLWAKAAPALLSGVPVIVKPASSTAWLAQRMVSDVLAAGILPEGALSIVCGEASGLLDQLQPFDVVAFTGSAATASVIRSHPALSSRFVRSNIEADSLNSALLLPSAPGDESFTLLVREVVREMTVKSGQKCTAIRRILVPRERYDDVAQAISSGLARVTVGDPRNSQVLMGALVNRKQLALVQEGIGVLRSEASILHDGTATALVDADPMLSACIGPTLLGAATPESAVRVHDTEVFGPVATLLPYHSLGDAWSWIQRGQGSLVTSVYGSDSAALAQTALELSATQGRVHVVSAEVAASHTGHGNVMPMSTHGGPGRAGGGEELGGLRALLFYHRRCALQASAAVLEACGSPATYGP